MKMWQMGFLLVIYMFSLLWGLTIDYSMDGKWDQPINYPLIVLIIMFTIPTVWYGLSSRPHMYVR